MRKSTRFENNSANSNESFNETGPMYITCSLAHPEVGMLHVKTNEPQSMHGFIKILRSANLFHQIQDYFQFHNYENGRDAVNGGQLLSFKITPPFPQTHKFSHQYANEYISVPFLKDPHLATVRALREGRVQKKKNR